MITKNCLFLFSNSFKIKRIVNILLIGIAILISIALLIYLLLWLPPVQQKVKDVALREIMKKTQNQMSIGDIRFRPFNHLQLQEVYVGDLQGDTLLYANNVSARFNLRRLFHKHLLIQSVDLEDFVIKINRENPDSDFNFQFLIDAFASEPDTTASQMTIQIQDISLKKGRLKYDVFSEPDIGEGIFDANHIHLRDFQSSLDLNSLDIQNLDVLIHSLSFAEKSGLTVSDFQTTIRSIGDRIQLTDFGINFPHSELSVPEAWFDFQSMDYALKLGENRIDLTDFKMFSAELNQWTDDLTLSGQINGKLPEIRISQLQANYGNHIQLKMLASIQDINQLATTPVELNIERFSMDLNKIREIQLPVKLGSISLAGTLKGTLANASVHLSARSDQGAILLNGRGGYEMASGNSHFDATLLSNNLDVAALLQDTLFGLAAGQIQAKGVISSSGYIDTKGTANLDRFDFNGYSYNHLQAIGSYRGDSIRLYLRSNDPNIDANLRMQADIGKTNPGAKLRANIDCIYLDVLNFFPDYKDAFLNTQLNIDISGFNPEKMKVNVAIDSLSLYTNKGSFHEPKFRFNYQAVDSCEKQMDITSRIANAYAYGKFSYAGLMEALKETFPMLFPDSKLYPKKRDSFAESLNFRIGMNDVNLLSDILDLPREMPDSALFIGKFQNDGQTLNLSASAYTRFTESDTLQLSVSLSNKKNNLAVIFNVDNRSNNYDFDGSLDAEIAFIPKKRNSVPDMDIAFNPTTFVINETDFYFNPARMEIREGRYSIQDFSLNHSADEYIHAEGTVSASRMDSLRVTASQIQFATLFNTMKSSIPLTGVANGQIVFRNLLDKPFVLSRGFAIDDIVYAGNHVGNLDISSGWSSERNSLLLRTTLTHPDRSQSVISGYALPEKDSLAVTANIHNIELNWFQEPMRGILYGLEGDISANLKINGKISNPTVSGTVSMNQAKVGIDQLNTMYSINDSVYINPKTVEFKQFTILDPNQQKLTIDGNITHQSFSNFNPNLTLNLTDFLVLDNARKTDSLFYGNMRINGALSLKNSGKDWLLSGNVQNSKRSKVWVNIPSSSSAQQHNGITFINTETEKSTGLHNAKASSDKMPLPLRLDLAILLNQGLEMNAVFDSSSGDKAQISGDGLIQFLYNMNTDAMSFSGDYTIASGQASFTVANIAQKAFTIQPGGKLVFRGDPMSTTFNLSALYNLRTDLSLLDPSFINILNNTRVPVTCVISANGNIDNPNFKYNILLPNESADVQHRLDGILYTDELRIRQIAFLLAFGSFIPASNNTPSFGTPNWVNSLASLTGNGLGNLLSNVLSENWSVGADFHAGNSNAIDMDVSVNTSLFRNRLMLNGSLGYNNDPNRPSNITSDFEVEYKLIPAGNILLRFYNVTNNQYFDQSKTTQGAGILYRRESKTFRQLFEKLKKRVKK